MKYSALKARSSMSKKAIAADNENRKRLNLSAWLLGRKPPPSIPSGQRAYIVGDIHGCSELLDRLLEIIIQDAVHGPARRFLVFVGDYVDRGRGSRSVIDRLLSLPNEFETHYLRGNHDQAMLNFLSDPDSYRVWKTYGAPETLLSYGVRPPKFDDVQAIRDAHAQFLRALPEPHLKFLENLELSWEIGDYFVVHAGVRPGLALSRQHEGDLLWIRDIFLYADDNFGKIIVHGHTAGETPVRRHNRIGIDTGAYATGRLTALVLEGTDSRFLQT